MSTETETEAAGAAEGSLLDTILSETKLAPGDEAYDVTKQGVQAFISEMLKGRDAKKIDKAAVDAMIAELDQRLSKQLNEILHHAAFQKVGEVEAAWKRIGELCDAAGCIVLTTTAAWPLRRVSCLPRMANGSSSVPAATASSRWSSRVEAARLIGKILLLPGGILWVARVAWVEPRQGASVAGFCHVRHD